MTMAIDSRGVRRLFQFAVLFALMIILALGVEALLRWSFDALHTWEQPGAVLARSLAFTLIGGPLAALLAWWSIRSQRRDPAERRSFLFAAYLTLAAVVALVVMVVNVTGFTAAAVSGSLELRNLAGMVSWGGIWLAHWLWAKRHLTRGRNTAHLLLGSLVGLVTASIGFIDLLGGSLDLLVRSTLTSPLPVLGTAAGPLVAGVFVWSRYWALDALRLPRRGLWLVYVLLIGVGGGLVLALITASTSLWHVAVWFLGDPSSEQAIQHFNGVWFSLAAAVLGALLWWYHRTILGHLERSEVRRIYEYLVSGLALVAAAVGVGTVIVALIEAATPGTDVGLTSTNTLLAALTLLLVGTPVWWLFWARIQRALGSDPHAERASTTRRVYLVVLFGVAGVATVIAAITAGVTFFNDVIEGSPGVSTVRLLRYSLGTIAAAAAVFAYHFAVYRADRQAPAPEQHGPRSVLFIGGPHDAAAQLTELGDARVEHWPLRHPQADLPAWDLEEVARLMAGHDGEDVVVIAEADGPKVIGVHR